MRYALCALLILIPYAWHKYYVIKKITIALFCKNSDILDYYVLSIPEHLVRRDKKTISNNLAL